MKMSHQAKSFLRYILKTRGNKEFDKKSFEKEICALQDEDTLFGRVPEGLIINGWNFYLVKFKKAGILTQINDTPKSEPSKREKDLTKQLEEALAEIAALKGE